MAQLLGKGQKQELALIAIVGAAIQVRSEQCAWMESPETIQVFSLLP